MNHVISKHDKNILRETTCNLNDGSSVIAKLIWLRNNSPKLYEGAEFLLLGAHDYINWMLCGSRVTDYTNASTTGLFDIKNNSWALSLLEKLNIRTDWLPELKSGYQITGHLKKAIAHELGLEEGLPIFHGVGDAASATIGSSAGEPGHFYIYLGTSWWLATSGFNEIVDPHTGIWNLRHVNPDRMMYLGPMLTTAGNWEWVIETFGDLEVKNKLSEISTYAILEKVAAESPAGSNGVVYLPMIRGERAPVRDPNARGVFFGIQTTTTRADLYRSVLEGVAYAMLSIRDIMQENLPDNINDFELVLTGGGAKSNLWAQIFSDVMNCTVKVLSSPEDVGVKGMAIVAGKTFGWHKNLIPEGSFLQFEQTFEPSLDSPIYRRCYQIYKRLYPSLKSMFTYSANILAK